MEINTDSNIYYSIRKLYIDSPSFVLYNVEKFKLYLKNINAVLIHSSIDEDSSIDKHNIAYAIDVTGVENGRDIIKFNNNSDLLLFLLKNDITDNHENS